MAWKAPEIEDSSTPPEYSKDDLPPPPRSHCSASTQTEHTECAREEFSVTVSFNSDSQSACVACGRVPAIAAVRLRCGHSLCAFHLAFFVDGYHTWMAQQASSSTAPSFPVASSAPILGASGEVCEPPLVPAASLTLSINISGTQASSEPVRRGPSLVPAALSTSNTNGSSTQAPHSVASGEVHAYEQSRAPPAVQSTSSLNTSDTQAPAITGSNVPGEMSPSTINISAPTSTSNTDGLDADDNPFIDPEEDSFASQLLASNVDPPPAPGPGPASAPALALDSAAQSQPSSPLASGASSPGSASSGSSSASYESWTSDIAALAHQITAAFEQLEFRGGPAIQEEALEDDGAAEVFSSDSDVEMVDAEDDGN